MCLNVPYISHNIMHSYYNHIYHHSHRTEQRFQIIRELGAAGVPRIHRDKYGAGRIKTQLGALEHQSRLARDYCPLYCQDLLCDDGQYLEVDPIELVEARPGAGGGETLLCEIQVT